MSAPLLGGLLLIALVGGATAASAEPAAPAAPADRPVRVHASHRVDVIAPGERVDTIIDRMRTGPAPAAAEGKPADRLPVRGPDRARGPERAPGKEKQQRGAPGAHAPAQAGSPAVRPLR